MPSALDVNMAEQVASVVRSRAGLRLRSPAMATLRDLVSARVRALGVDFQSYLDLIHDGSPTSGELEVVLRELTVGETHFFRTPAQFEVLRNHILPERMEAKRGMAPPTFRILSAGCATGEEPYSLAILLRQVLGDFEKWRASVLGIDINTAFLERARQGLYSNWSLRGVSSLLRGQYFSREGRSYRLHDDIRSMAHFRYLNLAFDPLPAPAMGIVGMDLIVCQNVLYYFEREVREAVLKRLVACLASGGWLLLGPADLLEHRIPLSSARVFGNVVAYQRTERQTVMPPSMRPSAEPLLGRAPESTRPPPPAPAPVQTSPTDGRGAVGLVGPSLEDAVELANAGNLAGAIELFELVLEAEPENARAHMLHGFLRIERGEFNEALSCMRRALYLDQYLVLAHAGTAMIARQLGMEQLMRRHSARVRALAKSQPPDQPVSGWDGMTLGRLLRLFEEEERHVPRAGGQA